ncbi:hypothetical protein BDW59DRAFT_49762 [Aspergillus cavernicola]|uniref:Zn(2)-C6 fungal-type domain-containing protein n=1 Tax=Aspergillus cavernicola TaxID=176166 RepID=A0ABR4IML0_9EURO
MQSVRSNIRKRPSQQRPVSCHFCRSRKLRCSRRFPCPNCTSRGISCQLYASQPLESCSEGNNGGETSTPTLDILARLQRLEDIVLRKSEQAPPVVSNPASDNIATQSRSPGSEQHATEDARWLEIECSIQGVPGVIESDKSVFRSCTIKQIKNATSILHQNSSDVASGENLTKCFWVPLYEESKYLVEKYIEDLTFLLHVVHIPSLRATVDTIYQQLHSEKRPKLSHVALLLSIIASTLYSWSSREPRTLLSLTVEEISRCPSVWLKATLNLLEYASQTSTGSLEEIQARIITSSVVCNLEGVSSRYRSLISAAITGARELRLHRIDHGLGSAYTDRQPGNTVEDETGRRVWWYLIPTDWILSHYEGPLKGTYTVNPRHMLVRKPMNIDDTDLVCGELPVEQPMEYPTYVSYTLQRIQLAEICRELTDCSSIFGSDNLDYDLILENDQKMKDYIMGFPTFFRLDGGSLNDIVDINPHVASGIIIQRYILNVLAHAHRCRLHLPYFSRGSVNPKYSYSRGICLEAARAVIRTERLFEKESIPFVATRFRFAGSLHCLCMAIIVFVLDVCLYKDEEQEEERKREAADACSILQKAKQDSSIADRLLQSFMRIIQKHKVSIHGVSNANLDEDGASFNQAPASLITTNVLESSINYEVPTLVAEESFLSPQSSYWTGIRENFNSGLEAIDWNALFFELEAQGLDDGSLF